MAEFLRRIKVLGNYPESNRETLKGFPGTVG